MKSLPQLSLAVLLALSVSVASSHAQDPWGTSGGSISGGAIFISGDTGATGVTTVNSGTLQIGSSNPFLGSGGNQVIVVNGGTITTTTGGTLTLTNVGQTSGGVLLQSYNPILGGGTLTLDPWTGVGLVKIGGGTLDLGTVNTFTGGTIIGTTTILNSGTGLTLSTGVGAIIATGGTLTLGNIGVLNGTITGVGLQQGNTLAINPNSNVANIGTASSQLVPPPSLPEPSVAALLACGAALGLRRQRKR